MKETKMLQLKSVIAKLDRQNRIRKMQGLPRINYDILEVDTLCERYKDDDYAIPLVVKIIEQNALSKKH
jgi:hypothetical protein